jgi:hypothetical protein
VVLGVLWIVDGALQLQPFMFGRGFARQVIAPAGVGQPRFVASGVHRAADLIVAHPVPWDVFFALTQLAIGAALVVPRTAVARAALTASMAWSMGVWYLGEGLGGLGSGRFDLATGAPGAVLFYALLAVAAWPTSAPDGDGPPPPWLAAPWALLWLGAAVWLALPAQHGVSTLVDDVRSSGDDAPGWLATLDRSVAAHLHTIGTPGTAAYVLVLAAIGLGGLFPGTSRRIAAGAAIVLATLVWVFGQGLGELFSGRATDPNSAPLLVVLALALASAPPARSRASVTSGELAVRETPGRQRGPGPPARSRTPPPGRSTIVGYLLAVIRRETRSTACSDRSINI